MSLYLLDTDIVSLYQHGHPRVCGAVAEHLSSEVVISVMTVEEQLSGWYSELRRAKKPPMLAAIYERMAKTVRFTPRCRSCRLRSQRSLATRI